MSSIIARFFSMPLWSPAPPQWTAASLREWIAARQLYLSVATVTVATALGMVVRLIPVLRADFPVNDGGLFYLMVEELRAADYVLPAYTSYNSAQIPFAYPPLAFYLAGFITDITGWPLLEVLRVLPALFSIATIPAFFLLSRAVLRSWTQATFAVFAFALLPRTFVWFIMGGGLTRAPGLFFAVLMLHQSYLLYTRRETRFVLSTALLGGATVLSHAEAAWFAVYSAVLLFLFFGRNLKGLIHSFLVMLGVLLITAPWWLTVVRFHGIAPFLGAAGSGGLDRRAGLHHLNTFLFTNERYLPLLAALGLLGIFAALAERKLFLPVWLLAIFFVNPRNPDTPASLPLAMLVGVALDRLIVPALWRLGAGAPVQTTGAHPGIEPSGTGMMRRTGRLLPRALPVLMLVYLLAYNFQAARELSLRADALTVLPREEREAMQWVAARTPRGSQFLVLHPGNWFGEDPGSEWFPALAGRVSLATVQGYEWLPGDQFVRRQEPYKALQACATGEASCLAEWMEETGHSASHVYLGDGCCGPLERSLRASPGYRPVYDGARAVIFARSESPVTP